MPVPFEHLCVFSGSKQVECERVCGDFRVRLPLHSAADPLVGILVIVAQEMLGKGFWTGNVLEDLMQAKGAPEQGHEIDNAPGQQLCLYTVRRLAQQKSRKTLESRFWGLWRFFACCFYALFNPSDKVLADVKEHLDFGITSRQKLAVQIVARFPAVRQHTS